jgi:hypothetical protein
MKHTAEEQAAQAAAGQVAAAPAARAELAAMHDFAAKLCQPSLLERLRGYVQWQTKVRAAQAAGQPVVELMAELRDVPISRAAASSR